MTPQELAVIQAAIDWRNSLSNTFSAEPLTRAVDVLIYSCPQCYAGGHTCPGDGNSIPHGASDCGQHHAGADGSCPDYGSRLDPCPRDCASGICVATDAGRQELERRRTQERHLSALVLETARGGWLGYAEWLDDTQVKVTHLSTGTMRVTAESGRGDVIGEFAVTVTARKLPPPGPEDDGALRDELAATEKSAQQQDELIWVPRTWQDVRTGDRVRMPGSANEAHVAHAVHQHWHVDPRTGTSSFNPPRAMEWECVHVVLTDRADQSLRRHLGEWDMDPAKPIEIQISASELDAMILLNGEDEAWHRRKGLIATHVHGSMPGDEDE